MTTTDKVARRKLTLLELAHELGNVSKACKLTGYSRQQFYEIRRNYQTYGADGLIDRLPGAKGPHPNRVSAEVEKAVLDFSLAEPTKGCLAVAQHLNLQGITVARAECAASGAGTGCCPSTTACCGLRSMSASDA